MSRLTKLNGIGEFELNACFECGENAGPDNQNCGLCEHHFTAEQKLGDYEDAEENGLLLRFSPKTKIICYPEIKYGKTLYWIWDNKIVKMKFKRICGGCVPDGVLHIMGEMVLINDVTINGRIIKKGDKRYLYLDSDIGKTVFLTKESAKKTLAGGETVG